MSQIDTEESIMSETGEGQSLSESLKLVPVAESIRYRKRAQSAEKKIEIMAEQLAESQAEATNAAEQLREVQLEQRLTRKLAGAGTVDLDAAVLIAKSRMKDSNDADLEGVVEQLKKEKPYLFGTESAGIVKVRRTAGAKDRMQNTRTILIGAAEKAAKTGNRTDLQEYLKLRRSFV